MKSLTLSGFLPPPNALHRARQLQLLGSRGRSPTWEVLAAADGATRHRATGAESGAQARLSPVRPRPRTRRHQRVCVPTSPSPQGARMRLGVGAGLCLSGKDLLSWGKGEGPLASPHCAPCCELPPGCRVCGWEGLRLKLCPGKGEAQSPNVSWPRGQRCLIPPSAPVQFTAQQSPGVGSTLESPCVLIPG